VYYAVFLRNFIFAAVILDLFSSFNVLVSLPYSRVGIARVLCIHRLVYFWTLEGFKTLVMVPVICRHFDNLFAASFSCSYDCVS
jgi:hypothetical protein